MNIDNLTFGELKQIAAMFGATQQAPQAHPMVGQYVILRCQSAGVHAGELVSQTGDSAVLKNSRRLSYWKAANAGSASGQALSNFAMHGAHRDSRFDAVVPSIALTGVIETIPCSTAAQESINAI
jgi:hypothetical protein